jgi:hypothetical protein
MDVLRRIPNLRKVSASYFNNVERLVNEVGSDYILSYKPNPAIFVQDHWDPDGARQDLRNFLTKTGGQCHVELIMKDISTVCYGPEKLWEWARIASEVAEEFAR